MQATSDLKFDETRGGAAHPSNMISCPVTGVVYLSTHKVFPWTDASQGAFKIIPSIHLERLIGKCKAKPEDFEGPMKMVLTHCLDEAFIESAFDELIVQGAFTEEDENGNEITFEYDDINTLISEINKILEEMKDAIEFLPGPASTEWLNGFNDRQKDAPVKWFSQLSWSSLIRVTGDLTLIMDLKLALGDHGLEDARVDPAGTCFNLIGGGQPGGLLCAAVKKFYQPAGQAQVGVDPGFLLDRIPGFLAESAWPEPYDVHFVDPKMYTMDISRRAALPSATRAELAPLLQDRLPLAIQLSLGTLHAVYEDWYSTPTHLAREVQLIGDLLLPGDDNGKMTLQRIKAVDELLENQYGGLIQSEVDAGATTAELHAKLLERARHSRATGRAELPPEETNDKMRPPKVTQITRATSMKEYTRVELTYTPVLRSASATKDEKLEAIREGFGSNSMVILAVLLEAKGARINMYLSANGADFLTLIHAERHLCALYFGQSVAFDEDTDEVPEQLKTFHLEEKTVTLLSNFEWDKIDFLNDVILKVRGAEAGTTFQKANVKKLYHDTTRLLEVQDIIGKLFESIGYPRVVKSASGFSFRSFIGALLKIQKAAVALPPDEQKSALEMIDRFVLEGLQAAMALGKRTIYGPNPADAQLYVWLAADEKVAIELNELLEAMKDVAAFRRKTGGIFSGKPAAAKLLGFELGGKQTPDDGDGGGGIKKGGKQKNKKGKKNPGPGGKTPVQTGGGGGGAKTVGSQVVKARVIPYANGDFSIGARLAPARRARSPGPRDRGKRPRRMTKTARNGGARRPSHASNHRATPRGVDPQAEPSQKAAPTRGAFGPSATDRAKRNPKGRSKASQA